MGNPVTFPPIELPKYPTTEVYEPLPGTELPPPVIPPEPPPPDPPTTPKKD